MTFLYNIFFPLGVLLFSPGIIYKLIYRPGYKKTYSERFGIFSSDRKKELGEFKNAVWVHAVSVGETIIAVSLLKQWREEQPDRKFILSTTTTTGQELARSKVPEGVPVFFCPLDWVFFVRKAVKLLQPAMLVIFETEIWPNLIREVRGAGAPVTLVNARMSDKSVRGYSKVKFFFRPLLEKLNFIGAQSEMDGKRFATISPKTPIHVCGNIKFDQDIPENMTEIDLKECFGEGDFKILLAASTHPGEEKLIASAFMDLKNEFPGLRLILVPRHAERGNEIVAELKNIGLEFHRRSTKGEIESPVDCLLADTTGEMLSFINQADIVFMGKSLAGHDEGHNLIEPALLSKPIITGAVLRNFRFVLEVLKQDEALLTVKNDDELNGAIKQLLENDEARRNLGEKAKTAINRHRGAIRKTIDFLNNILLENKS